VRWRMESLYRDEDSIYEFLFINVISVTDGIGF
jgi:hypothetical protein